MTPAVRYGYVLALLCGMQAVSRDEGSWWLAALTIALVAGWLDKWNSPPPRGRLEP